MKKLFTYLFVIFFSLPAMWLVGYSIFGRLSGFSGIVVDSSTNEPIVGAVIAYYTSVVPYSQIPNVGGPNPRGYSPQYVVTNERGEFNVQTFFPLWLGISPERVISICAYSYNPKTFYQEKLDYLTHEASSHFSKSGEFISTTKVNYFHLDKYDAKADNHQVEGALNVIHGLEFEGNFHGCSECLNVGRHLVKVVSSYFPDLPPKISGKNEDLSSYFRDVPPGTMAKDFEQKRWLLFKKLESELEGNNYSLRDLEKQYYPPPTPSPTKPPQPPKPTIEEILQQHGFTAFNNNQPKHGVNIFKFDVPRGKESGRNTN